MRSYLASLLHLVRAVIRYWWLVFAAAVLDGLDLAQYAGLPIDLPPRLMILPPGFALVFAITLAFHDLRMLTPDVAHIVTALKKRTIHSGGRTAWEEIVARRVELTQEPWKDHIGTVFFGVLNEHGLVTSETVMDRHGSPHYRVRPTPMGLAVLRETAKP